MKIIIVGAGIGGLSAALALSLQGDHSVLVLESAPALAEIGAGVQLTPDAIKFFFQWGMRDDILAKAAMPGKFVIHESQNEGRVLRQIDMRALEDDYGAPYVVVHRGVLHEILHRHAVRAGAEVRVNSRVVEYDFEEGSVRLKNGEIIHADLVVACDGIHSSARKQFLGDEDKSAQRTGWAAYRMMADVEKIKADPVTAHLVDQPNNHLWIGENYSAMTYMIYDSTVLNMVMAHPDDVDTTSWTPDEYMCEVKSLFKGWDTRVTKLIEMARPTVQNYPVYQVEPIPRWTSRSGKFVLMGDAAHAMCFYLSMGISLAVEDAAALAECLSLLKRKQSQSKHSETASDPDLKVSACASTNTRTNGCIIKPTLPLALSLWESQRKPRAEAIQRASLHAGTVLHMAPGPGREIRDALMAVDGERPKEDEDEDEIENEEQRQKEREEFSYGIADRRVRDWCYGFDTAEEIRRGWEMWFGRGSV